MLEFRVHEFITLKLEENKTVIYVAGEKFRQCSKLILEIPVNNITDFDEIQSIDGVVEKQWNEIVKMKYAIPPEEEFWGHCSNLQTWVENDYDTRLLHSYLSFPLLKKLAALGDSKAKKIIKEEITERFEENYLPTIFYLLIENYLNIYLNEEEQATLLLESNKKLRRKLKQTLREDIKNRKTESYVLLIIEELIREYDDKKAKRILKRLILRLIRLEKKDDFNHLIAMEGFKAYLFHEKEMETFLYSSPLFLKIIKNNPKITELLNIILGKVKTEEKKAIYEKLLTSVNYPENEEDIAEYIYEELQYIKYEKEKLLS